MYIREFASIKSFKVYLFAHNSKFMITFFKLFIHKTFEFDQNVQRVMMQFKSY